MHHRQTALTQDLLLTTLSSIGDGVISTDRNGIVTFLNPAAQHLTGWNENEALGQFLDTVFVIANENTGERLESPAAKLLRAGVAPTSPEEAILWSRNGGEIPIDERAALIRGGDGETAGVVLVFRDLTTMRESEARFRSLFDSNLVAIAFWDSSYFITEANDAYLSIIGYTRAEFEPGKISWRDLTPPEYRELDDEALREAHSNSVSRIYEKEYVRHDGKRTSIVIGVAFLSDSRNEGLVFALDISERARMQAHLLRSQKLESLSVLAGGIAHDFNNLLMGIIANASLMMDELPEDSPLAKLGENILVATEQAAHLTRQMLAYSGRGRFAVQPVCLASQVESISSLMKSSIRKTVKLRLNLATNLPRIHADAGQVQQVVMNLVLNAAESIDMDGTVTISASTRRVGEDDNLGSLAGVPLLPGQYVSLEVTDTGKGMDGATQAKMFDPFFSTKFVGRGLGLAAVLGIVRGHRGGIVVSSDPGQGTTFQVLFPVQREAQRASG